MNTKLITLAIIFIITMCIIVAYRANRANEISMYIIKNHLKLAQYLPEQEEMIFSFKPLESAYWVNQCIKNYAKLNQE